MSHFHQNPLYRRADKRARELARKEWNGTTAAKAVKELRLAATRSGSQRSSGHLRQAVNQLGKGSSSSALRALGLGSNLGDAVREFQAYSKLGGGASKLIGKFLGDLGPVGSLIQSVLSSSGAKRSAGIEGDVQSALDFLDAVAPEALSSHGRKRTTKGKSKGKSNRNLLEIAEQIESATDFLQQQGYEIKPPSGGKSDKPKLPALPGNVEFDDPTPSSKERTYPEGTPKTTSKGQPRRVVDIEINGRKRRFAVSHPIVTKRMVLTPESSNVWSYSYDVDSWTLYVRYRSSLVISTAGSLYGYSNVPPDVFLKMFNAPSKGTFIWDNIRIRGTVSGHRYDYSLVAVRQNYVPRKATMTPNGEMFVPRTVRVKRVNTGKVRTLKSGGEMRPGAHLYR